MNTQNNKALFYNIDWYLIWIYAILLLIGWLSVFASVYRPGELAYSFDFSRDYGKQLINISTSIVIAIVILLIDARVFRFFSWFFYGGSILLLILVLFVGHSVGGNKSWISLGVFRIQPSEFAKFATCLALANYLTSDQTRLSNIRHQILSFLIIAFPILLVLIQPDTGSAITFLSLSLVLYREGLPTSYLLLVIGVILLFIFTLLFGKLYVLIFLSLIAVYLIFLSFKSRKIKWFIVVITWLFSIAFVFSVDYVYKNVLRPHQRNRINEVLGITKDLKGVGYNVNQSKIAIGSGGFFGKGFLNGTQTKFDFVPEQSTDFIFCTIGEEWGFFGSLVIVSLYLFFLLRIIILAERQRVVFARIYGYAVACIFFCHFAINLGMTVGLLPVIGIPLPFISYGGSSLWGFTILLFIFLRLDSNRITTN